MRSPLRGRWRGWWRFAPLGLVAGGVLEGFPSALDWARMEKGLAGEVAAPRRFLKG